MRSGTLRCALLADRHHELSEGIRTLLGTTFDWVVMVADAKALMETAVKLEPEMAVVDVSLSQDCMSLLRQLRQEAPELKLILVSVHDEPAVARALMKEGADGFASSSEPSHSTCCEPLTRSGPASDSCRPRLKTRSTKRDGPGASHRSKAPKGMREARELR